jgi:hypothetical protein
MVTINQGYEFDPWLGHATVLKLLGEINLCSYAQIIHELRKQIKINKWLQLKVKK